MNQEARAATQARSTTPARRVAFAAQVAIGAAGARAGEPITYHLRFDNRAHHEMQVTARFTDLPPGTLELQLARTSPGRYAAHDFAKNLYHLVATDQRGEPLAVERTNSHRWHVRHQGTVVVDYTIYGDRIDGTYLAIDRHHAHLNAPAAFVWARGLERRPIVVTLDLGDTGWRVATQLERRSETEFAAPDLAYLIDSPIEASAFWSREWQVPGPAGEQTVALALHHRGSAAEAEAFRALVERVVDEEIALFGEAPRFDFGRYVFLADYLAEATGDGMEHRNSTVLTSPVALADDMLDLLGTVSHEFLHAWNIERLRPRSLEPFDLTEPTVASELWFGEGVTSYLDELVLARIGLLSLDAYAASLGPLLDGVVNAPGRRHRSPVAMSQEAPLVDGAAANDPTNRSNVFVSYYRYGAVLGLVLDLRLRTERATSHDHYLQELWRRFGRDERPYTLAELEDALAAVAGDPAWARSFFAHSVFGTGLPDLGPLAGHAGLLWRPVNENAAWLGPLDLFESDSGGLALQATPPEDSPLYRAGLDRGDVVVSFAGRPVAAREDLALALRERHPGASVRLSAKLRAVPGEVTELDLILAPDPAHELVSFERAGLALTDQVRDFRASWLGARSRPRHELRRQCPVCRRDWAIDYRYCPLDGEKLGFASP